LPFTVRVNAFVPAGTLAGLIEDIVVLVLGGTVGVEEDLPPPQFTSGKTRNKISNKKPIPRKHGLFACGMGAELIDSIFKLHSLSAI
jgi:hypothetical protein